MIKVKDLYKVIDGEVVLDHLNMQVEEGSIYGLMGPNGAGKTTLIRHLVGVLKQNAGKIFIESQPVYAPAFEPGAARRIGDGSPEKWVLYLHHRQRGSGRRRWA